MLNPIEIADVIPLDVIFFKSKIRPVQVQNEGPDYVFP
jgi:hypothetical protein